MILASRLTETITVQSVTGHTSAGDPTYGAQGTLAARIERNAARSADAEGQQDGSSTRLFTFGALKVGDLVWLPEDNTADQDQARVVMQVDTMRRVSGAVSHYESIV